MPRSGSTTDRGYGWAHQRRRARWAPKVEAGGVLCSRCGRPIAPGEEWDLDHTDDRLAYNGPAHKSENRAAGARKGNAVRRAVRSAVTTLRW